MRTLAVSPHLDDAAFSCGATLARLASAGDGVTLATVFTASVPRPRGFALDCQTSKGIAPDVDYMALRREEDQAAAAHLGIADVVHLGLPEAPHRGYASAPELFAGVRADDDAALAVAALLEPLIRSLAPERILAPLGLGGHVDHLVTIAALGRTRVPVHRWRDAPYVLRAPAVVRGDQEYAVAAGPAQLRRKLDACAAYASQLGFQFGGEAAMRATLRAFAEDEGRRLHAGGPAEALIADA